MTGFALVADRQSDPAARVLSPFEFWPGWLFYTPVVIHWLMLGLRHGDPHDELLGAWLAKESVRDIYLTEDPHVPRVLLDKAIVGCKSDEVDEIRSLGETLERWRTEILNHHRTGASNGPTEV